MTFLSNKTFGQAARNSIFGALALTMVANPSFAEDQKKFEVIPPQQVAEKSISMYVPSEQPKTTGTTKDFTPVANKQADLQKTALNEITVKYKTVENERIAQALSARISAVRDEGTNQKPGIVILFRGNDETIRDQIRLGASQAVDSAGNPIEVRGMIVAPGKTNDFEVYGDGYPSSNRLGPNNAQDLAKRTVAGIYETIIKPDFFAQVNTNIPTQEQ